MKENPLFDAKYLLDERNLLLQLLSSTLDIYIIDAKKRRKKHSGAILFSAVTELYAKALSSVKKQDLKQEIDDMKKLQNLYRKALNPDKKNDKTT